MSKTHCIKTKNKFFLQLLAEVFLNIYTYSHMTRNGFTKITSTMYDILLMICHFLTTFKRYFVYFATRFEDFLHVNENEHRVYMKSAP